MARKATTQVNFRLPGAERDALARLLQREHLRMAELVRLLLDLDARTARLRGGRPFVEWLEALADGDLEDLAARQEQLLRDVENLENRRVAIERRIEDLRRAYRSLVRRQQKEQQRLAVLQGRADGLAGAIQEAAEKAVRPLQEASQQASAAVKGVEEVARVLGETLANVAAWAPLETAVTLVRRDLTVRGDAILVGFPSYRPRLSDVLRALEWLLGNDPRPRYLRPVNASAAWSSTAVASASPAADAMGELPA